MNTDTIELFPSNWLYDAGAIGFTQVLQSIGEDPRAWISNDGIIAGDLTRLLAPKRIEGTQFELPLLAWGWLLESWRSLTKRDSTTEVGIISEIWGKLFNGQYRGFFNANTRQLFEGSLRSGPIIEKFAAFVRSLGIPVWN